MSGDTLSFNDLTDATGSDAQQMQSSQERQRPTTINEDESSLQHTEQHLDGKPAGEITPLKEGRSQAALTKSNAELRSIIIAIFSFSTVITVVFMIQLAIGHGEVIPKGGVSSCAKACSDIGVDILKKGGSAVDSAVATMLCVGVVNPQFAGIGGGGFMIVHNHRTGDSSLLDFRETAPARSNQNNFHTSSDAHLKEEGKLEPKYVGVPGELKGLFQAHQRFGKLHWRSVVLPAAQLAKRGFPLSKSFESWAQHRAGYGEKNRKAMEKFLLGLNVDLQTAIEGTIIQREKLGYVLERIANEGITPFYEGDLGKEVVDTLAHSGVWEIMSPDDLKRYKVEDRHPLIGSFDGTAGMSNAHACIQGECVFYCNNRVLQKGALEQQMLEDPRFGKKNVSLYESNLISKKYAEDETHNSGHIRSWDDHGTSHVSVIDKDDLMVSATHSLNHAFGSLIETKSGILLNDQLADFDLSISKDGSTKVNGIQPNKRPRSSMIPTILHHKTHPCLKRAAIGTFVEENIDFSPGGTNGTRILSGVAEVIIRMIRYGESLSSAIDEPRLYCNGEGHCEFEGQLFTNNPIKHKCGVGGLGTMRKKFLHSIV